MPRYELRFRRSRDQSIQSVSFDAASAHEALTLLPRHSPADQHQLWCDDALLFTVGRAEKSSEVFWVISTDHTG